MALKTGGSRSSDIGEAFQPRQSRATTYSAIRKSPPIRSPWPIILLLTLTGVAGFVTLLVCSHYVPALANPLRVAALIWFFGFGLAETSFIKRQR